MRRQFFMAGLVLALPACASHATPSSSTAVTRSTTTRRTNVISLDEILEHRNVSSVGDLVRQVRPGWRAAIVYVNNDPFGDIGSTTTLMLGNVREIRYLTASEAQMKWGSSVHEVIQVITK